jgi:hypothetical protein
MSAAAARDNQIIRLNRRPAANVVAARAKVGDYDSVAAKRCVAETSE